MMKKTIALLAILALCGLLPAVAQEVQEEMETKTINLAEEAKLQGGEMAEKAEAAEARMEEAKKMLESEAEGEAEAAADLPSLDEVLASHYQALGGTEAWSSVEAVRYEGNMVMGPGMEAPFTMTQQRGDRIRLEFVVQGMTGIQAYDGATAWMLMPFMGKSDPEEMPAEMAKQFKEQADIEGALFDWQAKGHTVEMVGAEEMEGTDVYKLKVTMENGNVRYHYLDSEYFLTVKQEGKTNVQGQEMDFESSLSGYKQVCLQTSVLVDDENPCEGGAVVIPTAIESKPKGAPAGQVITITSATFNPDDIAGDFFAMPPKPAAEEPAKAEG